MDKKKCDVVVIGAGIGGLCLAARLANAGHTTIVLEKMPILGGRYTYVDYKGYWIPTAAVVVMYGKNDPVLLTLKDLKIDIDALDMKVMPTPKWRINGKDQGVSPKSQVAQLVAMASRNKQEEAKIGKALSHAFKWRDPSDDITIHDWILNLTDNKNIYNIFQAISIQIIGPNMWEISAGEFFRYLRIFAGIEMLLPREGLKPIVDSLAKVIKDDHGEILTLVKVNKIIVQDGIATGVEAKGPEGELRIEAKAVVSDIGPKKTVELAGEENFDKGYLKEVAGLKPWAGMGLILASDGPLYDWPGGLYTIDTRRAGVWSDFTLIWPHFAPKGRNWAYFYLGVASITSYDPAREYKAFLADLHDTFPRFEEQHGEVLVVHHYNGEWPCLRAWPTAPSHRRTSVENLYNVGDAVNPPGITAGSGVAEASRIVAQDIMARIKV